MCEGNPTFWLNPDGTYVLEGMDMIKGNIWSKKSTKLLCALLSLPTPQHPNPRGKSNRVADGALSNYLEQQSLCKVLLVGIDGSGTSTIYMQARVLYDKPFSKEERLNIKCMIQKNLYRYLGRLLEGREMFEEENLLETKRQSTDPSPSGSIRELQGNEGITKYTLDKKLKLFSDRLIDLNVSGNLDMIFLDATQDFASFVEELWNDAAIQATYSRFYEFELPRVAKYFLDKSYVRTRDYCTTAKHIVTMCLNAILVSIEMGQFSHVTSYISKAEQTPEALDPVIIAKLRCVAGLANLEGRKYKLAARKNSDSWA